ncbi:MAG: MFS transporter [Polyangiales bacterium]
MAAPQEDAPKTTLAEDIRSLLASPRELWLIYAATFFEYLGIYSFLSTLKFWLSSDHGMGDVSAGTWASVFSTVATFFVVLVGPLADVVGIRRMLLFSFSFAAVTRLAMSAAPERVTALVSLFAFAFAYASTSPVLQVSVMRAASKQARAFAFSTWYVSFNLAGVAVGFIIDGTRAHFRDAANHLVRRPVPIPLLGHVTMSAHAAILAQGFAFAVVAAVIISFIRKDFGAAPEADRTGEPYRAAAPPDAAPSVVGRVRAALAELLVKLREVMGDRLFWRFMFMLVLLSLVKLIFQHMHLTWPTYVTRMEGEAFPVGRVWALNSFLILFLAPLCTAITRRQKALDVLLAGAFITAASPFILCFGSSIYHQVTMVVVLTIGEALWSPRSYEYNVSISPPGREATYVSLAALPFFLAKAIVGSFGGVLLDRFCPDHGPRQPAVLWALIGLVTMVGPVGILTLRDWIAGKPRDAAKAA